MLRFLESILQKGRGYEYHFSKEEGFGSKYVPRGLALLIVARGRRNHPSLAPQVETRQKERTV